jgi:hypothetical protein
MASAEALSILRGLQSKPDNKVHAKQSYACHGPREASSAQALRLAVSQRMHLGCAAGLRVAARASLPCRKPARRQTLLVSAGLRRLRH